MHELAWYGLAGLVAAVTLVSCADKLPVPDFKVDVGDEVDDNAEADASPSTSERVGGAGAGAGAGLGLSSFPSSKFSSSDSLNIVEEIVGVDTSDLNLGDAGVSGVLRTKAAKEEEGGRKVKKDSNNASRILVEKALGLNDEMRDKMQRQVKQEMAKNKDRGLANMDYVEPINVVKMIEWIIFVGLMILGCYALNEYSQGDFGRVVAGMFPREVKALGLQEFLERKGVSAQQTPSVGGEL